MALDPRQTGEPFMVRWVNGKLVPVEPPRTATVPVTLVRECGHETAAQRQCPRYGTTCACCDRCAGECRVDTEED